MTQPQNKDAFQLFVDTKVRSFSDELMTLRGKVVELYTGDIDKTMEYDDFSAPENCSIFGEIIDVLDRFVIIDCLFIDKAGEIQKGNRVYINTFQIRSMSELNGNGSLKDIYLSSRDAQKVRKVFAMLKQGD